MAEAMVVDATTDLVDSVELADVSDDASAEFNILEYLIMCGDVHFKSQQRGDKELTNVEKRDIASLILKTSKSNFLARFGKHLKEEHLSFFNKFVSDPIEGYDIQFYLNKLKRSLSKTQKCTDIRNRRYDALKKLIDEDSYFSEKEMMRRNPLLYDQLVGQYLSDEEKKKRDNIDTTNITFVNLLMESIERDKIRTKQKLQEEHENNAIEEEESDCEDCEDCEDSEEEIPVSMTKKWGEMSDYVEEVQDKRNAQKKEPIFITASERRLLQEEFKSIMYQDFLDGKDAEFDYSTVDNNDDYDNMDIKTQDAEEKYFDSESPEELFPEKVSTATEQNISEDELEVFMGRLCQHHSLQQLSKDMSKL